MKPITIIGGGLAGLSLGIALRRRDVPVILHEATCYPRHRVCGEFINGVGDDTLRTLGIADLLADARPLSSTAWFRNGSAIYRTRLEVPARGVSRYRLDARLADRFAGLGGDLRLRDRVDETGEEGEVVTTGRRPTRPGRWLGLKIHVEGLPLEADLEMHLGSQGYLGLAPVEDGRVNVCGLLERSEAVGGRGVERFLGYLRLNGLHGLEERLRSATLDADSLTGISAFTLGTQAGDADRCALGDAERMIPPFTGNGMSMAFEAAETAVPWLVDYATGRRAWGDSVREIRSALDERFRTRITAAGILHPLLLAASGQALLGALGRFGMIPFQPLSRFLR